MSFLSRISRKRKKLEPVAAVWRSAESKQCQNLAANSASFADRSIVQTGLSVHSNSVPLVDVPVEQTFPASRSSHTAITMSSNTSSSQPTSEASARPNTTPQSYQQNAACADQAADLMQVSVRALSHRSRSILSLHLNPPKLTGNDWRGLADYMDFSHLEIENFALRPDPMGETLTHWECKTDSTVGRLVKLLDELERDDAITALKKPVRIDVERYLRKKIDGQAGTDVPPLQVAEVSGTSYPNRLMCPELRGITLKDHPDGPIQTFDAYICHNTETDYPFVQEILDEMEKKYQLHFCTDWRDLVPGGSYATITAELIENRCKRMIVILSPEFLQSEYCDFHTKFALSLSPGARSKRMVLVMYKSCEPPSILRHITVCDYTKDALRPYFWPRLYAALNLS